MSDKATYKSSFCTQLPLSINTIISQHFRNYDTTLKICGLRPDDKVQIYTLAKCIILAEHQSLKPISAKCCSYQQCHWQKYVSHMKYLRDLPEHNEPIQNGGQNPINHHWPIFTAFSKVLYFCYEFTAITGIIDLQHIESVGALKQKYTSFYQRILSCSNRL